MRFRIIDRKKFNRFILLTITTVSIFTFTVLSVFTSTTQGKEINDIVVVKKGQTIWNIAENINSNRDIREVIYDIKVINNLDTGTIYPGDRLFVPAY